MNTINEKLPLILKNATSQWCFQSNLISIKKRFRKNYSINLIRIVISGKFYVHCQKNWLILFKEKKMSMSIKSWLNVENNITKWEKTHYCYYTKKLFLFSNKRFFCVEPVKWVMRDAQANIRVYKINFRVYKVC